ncbi:MAG TPA: DUF4189 domain-containing protein [Caldimonas sp.]|nr:DUF4189 domain-containing protein [Caldimonas sp.]
MPDFGIDGDHGAIAVKADHTSAALTARYIGQGAADDAAMKLCGVGCSIELRFEGNNVCGALAAGTNQTIGVATGVPISTAEAAALLGCQGAGGQACEIKLSACND